MKARLWNKTLAPLAVALGFLTLGTAGDVYGAPQSFNHRGTVLLIGAVSEEEREAIRQEAGRYNLWLAFLEQDTDKYVTGVKVSVVDTNDNSVIDAVADGPWLLAQLPPGRYVVRMGDGQEQRVTVSASGHAQTVLRVARQR